LAASQDDHSRAGCPDCETRSQVAAEREEVCAARECGEAAAEKCRPAAIGVSPARRTGAFGTGECRGRAYSRRARENLSGLRRGDAGQRDISDQIGEQFPDPRIEVHRFRRHVSKGAACGATAQGRGDMAVPGSHIGLRNRLLRIDGRGHLGISLGKALALFEELYGLLISRPGVLGQLRWFANQFDPVVQTLLENLCDSPVAHADESGWRIIGKNVPPDEFAPQTADIRDRFAERQ
jgi:hypothetical protein